jgi:hypothetical protein
MQVLQANDGFLWGDVTNIAESLWYNGEWDLYAIYDDGSEHLIEDEQDLIFYMQQKNIIVIELCPIEEIKLLN